MIPKSQDGFFSEPSIASARSEPLIDLLEKPLWHLVLISSSTHEGGVFIINSMKEMQEGKATRVGVKKCMNGFCRKVSYSRMNGGLERL